MRFRANRGDGDAAPSRRALEVERAALRLSESGWRIVDTRFSPDCSGAGVRHQQSPIAFEDAARASSATGQPWTATARPTERRPPSRLRAARPTAYPRFKSLLRIAPPVDGGGRPKDAARGRGATEAYERERTSR